MIPSLPGLLAHWADIEITSIFHFWPAAPNDFINFCSFLWCPRSCWYWQWRLLLHFVGSPSILFVYLKYGSFLIFSKTWCTGSRHTVLTTWVAVDPDCPAKSLRCQLLLYLSDLKSLLSWRTNLAFPLPCCWFSSTHLYLSIRSMSWRTFLTGFLVNNFLKSCSTGRSTDLESPYSHAIKVLIYLIKHFSISIKIHL